MDIEFDESYTARGTFIQRLSAEPRVPKHEGMQYVSEANAEVHYMLLGILLRPLHLPVPAASPSQQDVPMTEQERVLATIPAFPTRVLSKPRKISNR